MANTLSPRSPARPHIPKSHASLINVIELHQVITMTLDTFNVLWCHFACATLNSYLNKKEDCFLNAWPVLAVPSIALVVELCDVGRFSRSMA